MEQGRGMQRACPLQFLACCSHRQCSLPSPRSTESPKGAHSHGSSVTFKVRCICSWVSGALVAPRGACFLLKPEWQNAERRHRCSKKHDWQTTPSYPFWLAGLPPIDQSFTLKTMKKEREREEDAEWLVLSAAPSVNLRQSALGERVWIKK